MRKIFAVLLIPLLAALVFVALLGSTASGTLLRSVFWKSQLQRANVYNAAVQELTRQLTTKLEAATPADGPFSPNDIVPALQATVTPEWLQVEVERNLDSLDRWLSRGKRLALSLDVTDRKPVLEQQLDRIIAQQLSRLPACSNTQAEQQSLSEVTCIPSGSENVQQLLKSQGLDPASLITAMPDEIDLLDPGNSLKPFLEKIGMQSAPEQDAQIAEQLERFRSGLDSLRRGLILVYGALLAVLAVELLLVAQGTKTFMRWLGTFITATAILPLIAGVAGLVGSGALTVGRLQLEALGPEAREAVTALARNVLTSALTPLLVYGIIAVAASIALHIVGAFMRTPTPRTDAKRKKQIIS